MIKSWDEYFARICVLTAEKSEDESTQCGSVIVTQGNEVVSTGYNGFPRGIKNTPERQERPIKYKYFEHGERNAIYNCARNGVSTKDCKIYVTGVPCADCARAIVQSGMIEIIAIQGLHSPEFYERWKESTDFTKAMVEEAGVSLREYTFQTPPKFYNLYLEDKGSGNELLVAIKQDVLGNISIDAESLNEVGEDIKEVLRNGLTSIPSSGDKVSFAIN